MNQQAIIRIKRVAGKLARTQKMELAVPLAVWDSAGQLIGVGLSCDKTMGGIACTAQATFVLTPNEYASEDAIKAKTEIAIAALKCEVLVTIKPKQTVSVKKAG